MKLFKILAGAGLAILSLPTLAASCATIQSGTMLSFKATQADKFQNCISLTDAPNAQVLIVMATSRTNDSFKVNINSITANGSIIPISNGTASTGTLAMSVQPGGQSIAIAVLPNITNADADVSLTYYKDSNGAATIVYSIESSTTTTSPPDTGGGGSCNSRGICTAPMSLPLNPKSTFKSLGNSASAAPICDSTNTPPAEENKNYAVDINKELDKFAQQSAAITQLMLKNPETAIGIETTRATFMVQNFYTGRPYDLKNNPTFQTGEKFGNFFFGAAAVVMGYSEQQAITAGAVVQQVQNYTYGQGSAADMVQNAIFAMTSGLGDNPGDREMISQGAKYAQDIYAKDAQRGDVSNSCTRAPHDDTRTKPVSSSGSGGAGIVPGAGSGVSYMGGSCIGHCATTGVWIVSDPIELTQQP